MPHSITAFRIRLGPAVEPGLSTTQIDKRIQQALHIIHAIMPSARYLTAGVLHQRMTSENGVFWLSFDLDESKQLSLFNSSKHPSGQRITSTLAHLHSELAHLRTEAQSAVIRVGELAALAAELDALPLQESQASLAGFSPEDFQLWKLLNRRSGEALTIAFDDGPVNLTLPTLGKHLSEGFVRTIRFRVKYPGRRQTKISHIKETENHLEGAVQNIQYPRIMTLLRSPDVHPKQHEAWFLLYAAEYRSLTVEAKVRMALRRIDFSASHLELVEILNAGELMAAVPELSPE